MKKKVILSMLAAAFCALNSMTLSAQGVIVYKTDGTKIKVPYTLLDSIATYTYEEGQDDADDNAEVKEYTVGGVTFKMIRVEAGTFQMGSTSGDSEEKPVHSVTISKDYYIGATEVTQDLWKAVMGSDPSNFTTSAQLPVEQVSWNDCQTFITKLNSLTGATFRLPSEAEWEFAARGGNKSQGYTYSGSNTVGDVAWYKDNSSSKPHVVKTKAPNELGIYDMSGNVWEWCQDWYHSYSSSAVTDPTGPTSGSYRMFRGGGWSGGATYCRCADRNYDKPTTWSSTFGLRLASQ
jgi:formylglycine-generating enzyme required for sulfatase activity